MVCRKAVPLAPGLVVGQAPTAGCLAVPRASLSCPTGERAICRFSPAISYPIILSKGSRAAGASGPRENSAGPGENDGLASGSGQGGGSHPAGSSSADDDNLADRMFAHAAILHALTVEASAKAEAPRPGLIAFGDALAAPRSRGRWWRRRGRWRRLLHDRWRRWWNNRRGRRWRNPRLAAAEAEPQSE